jgi:cytochrome c
MHSAGSGTSRTAGAARATRSGGPDVFRRIAAGQTISRVAQKVHVSVRTSAQTNKMPVPEQRRTQMQRAVSEIDRSSPDLKAPRAYRRLMLATAALAAALGAPCAHAQLPEPTALVDTQHCMFCHTADAPFLAPSFHQIAERYRNTPHADAMLEHKLRLGGRAHWGDTPMPPAEDRGGPLSREDAHVLVQWVLSQ